MTTSHSRVIKDMVKGLTSDGMRGVGMTRGATIGVMIGGMTTGMMRGVVGMTKGMIRVMIEMKGGTIVATIEVMIGEMSVVLIEIMTRVVTDGTDRKSVV